MDTLYGHHLFVNRRGYEHHGIGVGNGMVVHFTGVANDKASAAVTYDTLESFAGGAQIQIVPYAGRFQREEVVGRALSLVGRTGYNVVANNCEHVARWCMTDEHRSPQIERASGTVIGTAGSGLTAAATTSATVAVSAAAETSGGAAFMSAAKAAGRLLGGGAGEGFVVMAAAPAVAANVAMHKALPDDPNLPEAERHARKAARQTTMVASTVGTAASVGWVAIAGVPGLSAVGIATGCAEIGALVGGGMLAGAAVAIAVPAAVAFLIGLVVHAVKSPSKPRLEVRPL
jgi:hypothetical protein